MYNSLLHYLEFSEKDWIFDLYFLFLVGFGKLSIAGPWPAPFFEMLLMSGLPVVP